MNVFIIVFYNIQRDSMSAYKNNGFNFERLVDKGLHYYKIGVVRINGITLYKIIIMNYK